MKSDDEHTVGSCLSLVKCVPVLQGTAFQNAAGALSGQDFSSCSGEGGSSIQGAGILNSEYLHKAQVSHILQISLPCAPL